MRIRQAVLAALLATICSLAAAEIVIGVSVSATGPGASLGVPIGNAFAILPKVIAGEPVRYIIVNDESDPSAGSKAIRKFVTVDNADAIVGSSSVPVAVGEAAIASELKVPLLALSPIQVDAAKQPWIFVVPQPVKLIVDAIVEHMKGSQVRSVGFIGFSDALGDQSYKALVDGAGAAGIKVVAAERFGRTDTSVTAQVLKVMAANPDAVFVGASGTPAALPQLGLVDRGFKGPVYHTHGVVNKEFLRVGGKSVEGVLAPTGPFVVAEQLPASNPVKTVGSDFARLYESTYGAGTRNVFAGYAFDAIAIIAAAAPQALGKAKPGTQEFRQALRDAIEMSREVVGTHAVYSMSQSDHNGVDARARVMVRVEQGEWRLAK